MPIAITYNYKFGIKFNPIMHEYYGDKQKINMWEYICTT